LGKVSLSSLERKTADAKVTKDRLITKWTMIGMGVFIAVVIGVVIAKLVVSSQRSTVSKEVDQAKARIAIFQSIERDYVVFAKKVQLMFALDKQREAKREAVKFFYNLIPQEDIIQQVQLDAKQSKILFQVESPDVFRMLTLLRIFREKVTKDVIFDMAIAGITRKPDGTYMVSGSLGYDVFGKEQPAKSAVTPNKTSTTTQEKKQ
jgi:uncharacterized membrane-anchored protein YhcB (DUF1043 family)